MTAVTSEEIKGIHDCFSRSKATGASGILMTHFKELLKTWMEVPAKNPGAFLQDNNIPDRWKISLVCPIPKHTPWEGNITQPRPIALIEISRKVCVKYIDKPPSAHPEIELHTGRPKLQFQKRTKDEGFYIRIKGYNELFAGLKNIWKYYSWISWRATTACPWNQWQYHSVTWRFLRSS